MTNEQKRQVRDALIRYAGNFHTQSEAAESLQGISASTISQVKNNNWELLSERLWHHIARQVGFYCGEWQPADTSAYMLLRILFSDAQHYAMAYGIAMGTGLGKTFTASHYGRENSDVFYIAGNEQSNRKSFITALLTSAGVEAKGTVPEMMEQFTNLISEKEEPLLLIDDAHKLKDRVLHLVVLLANSVSGNAGIVMMGDERLRTRIIDGLRMKKVGYDDIYKSIGRRVITLDNLGPKDVELVCRANGISDDEIIARINQECDDLHAAAGMIMQNAEMKIAA
jgi:hypothetical protein